MRKLILMLLVVLVGIMFLVASCSGPIAGQATATGKKCTFGSYTCKDDGSAVYGCTKAGKVMKYEDMCFGGRVFNYYCSKNGVGNTQSDCGTGKICEKGKCVSVPICDGNNLNLCTTQSACTTVGYWSGGACVANCPAGTEAGADKVCTSCTAGVTGKIKCVKDKYYNYAVTEFKNSDCSTTLGTKWPDKVSCGGIDCKEDVGCCVDKMLPIVVCEGNTKINQTQNACTGIIKDTKIDCSSLISYIDGKNKVCGTNNNNNINCYEACTPGETVITCNSYNYFYSYTCNSDGLGYGTSSKLTKCPEGQTCTLFTGTQNGLCTPATSGQVNTTPATSGSVNTTGY